VTLAEIKLEPRTSFEQDVPTGYNGFVYVVSGSARLGEDAAPLTIGQVGWLDRPEGTGISLLRVVTGDEGARLVLYAGQPQGDPIVSQGPFIGDSREDIVRLHTEYRAGRFERMSQITRAARPIPEASAHDSIGDTVKT
jgi:redox-sensitive bicupin YhaK (pirin superfamily)